LDYDDDELSPFYENPYEDIDYETRHVMFFDNLYEFYLFDDIDDNNDPELNEDVDYTNILKDEKELEELTYEEEKGLNFSYEDSEYEKAEYEDEVSFLDVSKKSYSYDILEFFVRIIKHYHLILLI
jgi:hypothetical protein